MIDEGKVRALARRCFPRLALRWKRVKAVAQHRRITEILSSADPPDCAAAEAAFSQLQATYAGVPEYGYDAYSTWRRGLERALALVAAIEILRTPGARVIEVACGDGMTAAMLDSFGHDVSVTDLEDWRDPRAKQLRFWAANICQPLPFDDAQFDVCVTFNSFEHFPDPAQALSELIRVLKPGGWLFTEFGPLYCGPWGLHAYRTLRMPYPQFLFTEPFWRASLKALGMRDFVALQRIPDKWAVLKCVDFRPPKPPGDAAC